LRKGFGVAFDAVTSHDAWPPIRLSLLVAASPCRSTRCSACAAAWAIAKHDFPGKSLLITLIDLPFSVSPCGRPDLCAGVRGQGWFGGWLQAHNLQVVFAVPGIVLATIFVTFPVHRPRADPADDGAGGFGGGGGGVARRLRPRHLLEGHCAQRALGPALRRPAV